MTDTKFNLAKALKKETRRHRDKEILWLYQGGNSAGFLSRDFKLSKRRIQQIINAGLESSR